MILLFTPVRLPAEMIPDMVASHASLRGNIVRLYIDDCDEEASRVLRDSNLGNAALIDGKTLFGGSNYQQGAHTWNQDSTNRIIQLRNFAISFMRERRAEGQDITHLFSCDADLLLHPSTIEILYGAQAEVVSEVFWSKWHEQDVWMPNVWDVHDYAFHGPDSVTRLREPGHYTVGGLGACTLIHHSVFDRGVDYRRIESWMHWGEDRDFSLRCSMHNIRLVADTHVPPFHVYRESMREEARKWVKGGCDPSYFRHHWLTDDWAEAVQKRFTTMQAVPVSGAKRKITVCLPGENFSSVVMANWTTLFGSLLPIFDVDPIFGYSSNVYVTRMCMTDQVLKSDHPGDYVLWIDDDNVVNINNVARLIQDLEENPEVDVVAGWCWVQPDDVGIPGKLSCGRINADGSSQLFTHAELMEGSEDLKEVGYTGFPVVLMRIGALRKAGGAQAFRPYMNPRNHYGFDSEDVSFCRAATRNGCRLFVDRRVKVPHLKRRDAGPTDVPVAVAELVGGNAA